MRPHLPRYLALCHSRIAPTVSLAHDALAQLDAQAPLDGGELFEALRPVLASAVKGQIEAALKLVDKTVKREPKLSGAAASLVAQGLLLESAPLQKLILKRLEAWGVDDPARALVRSVGGSIAAVNRPAWQRLAGAGQEPEAAKDRVMPVESAPARREGPLDPERRLLPVTTIEELVECIAHVFENDLDIDAFERAVGGVVALAPFVDAQRRALAPVLKRAAKVRRPLPLALARLLLAVVEGRELAAAPSVDAGGNPSPV
jgi:hypothetical protein